LIIVVARFAPYRLQHARVFFAFCEVRPMIGLPEPDEMFSLGRAQFCKEAQWRTGTGYGVVSAREK
jgi:hypothetical protein